MKNIGDIKNKNIDALLNSKNIYYEGGGKTLNNIIYPIGSVVIRVDSQNPSYWYGGTWELLCPGRTMVCIDTNDSDFNVIKKTGGEKTHKLTIPEIPSHTHGFKTDEYNPISLLYDKGTNNWYGVPYNNGDLFSAKTLGITNTGGSQSHNNLQPYMVVYIWVRTK